MNERLIVKDFGPVRDVDIRFSKVTVFTGDQGTGKSCLAKLFSMFVWLEKQIHLQRKSICFYEEFNHFKNQVCSFHGLESFITETTYIRFEGQRLEFEYDKGQFHITAKTEESHSVPKIMFVPGERSIARLAESRPGLLKVLPSSLRTFLKK